jgi:uncharacterized protein
MLLTAFLMGMAGSLHCAGMCSPLAFAVTNLKSSAMMNRILYNIGRITTYGILGAITATIGYILPFSKYQNLLSITMGASLIVMAVMGITGARIPIITNAMVKLTAILKTKFSKHIRNKRRGTLLFLGALNGLLPCGLTFLALSLCITLTVPAEGFLYMLVFGVGTLPVMLGLVSIVDIVKNKMQWNINKITTGLMILSGILLIARVFLVHLPEGHTQEMNVVDIVICR